MNRFTSALAGLALMATASIAPALAQGTNPGTFTFPGPGTFSFTDTPAGFVNTTIPVVFNPMTAGSVASTGTLTLTGGVEQFGATGIAGTFTGVTETFTPNAGQTLAAFTDTGTVFVSQRSATTFDLASDTTTFTTSGTNFDLVPGTPGPVPEASTTVSFGALLALGVRAVALRRTGVKNAA